MWLLKHRPERMDMEYFWIKSPASASNLSLSFHMSVREMFGPIILKLGFYFGFVIPLFSCTVQKWQKLSGILTDALT